MAFTKITSNDLINKGVTGMPDTPGLSTTDMQKKFDELSKDVVIPKFNKLIDDMESTDGAGNIGMEVPEGITADPNTQSVMEAVAKKAGENASDRHSHENKTVLDLITELVKSGYDRLVTLFSKITEISDTVIDSTASLPNGKAIVAYVKKMGGGDMASATYDTNESGIVDDAERLGGELPSAYQKRVDESLQTESKEIVGAINEVLNMDPDTVDPSTATEEGLAADAKKTGELIKENADKIGDLTSLKTTAKGSLAEAVNEQNENIDDVRNDLTELIIYNTVSTSVQVTSLDEDYKWEVDLNRPNENYKLIGATIQNNFSATIILGIEEYSDTKLIGYLSKENPPNISSVNHTVNITVHCIWLIKS